ncbi:MAG: diguanylate cyclase [Gammaproteobacteria bacterium]|nr:diguanylate cyclase [Gammaproteobacteria bacterium]
MATIVLLLGLAVMIGWIIKSDSIIRISNNFAPMQFNTALTLFLCGLSIFLISSKWRFVLCLFIFMLGCITLLEYILDFNLGIDEYFVNAYLATPNSYPGRMAVNTALSFIFTSISLGLLSLREKSYSTNIIICLNLTIISLSVLAIIGYSTDLSTSHGLGQSSKMAIHTSFGLILISLCVLMYLVSEKNIKFLHLIPWIISFFFLNMTFLAWQSLKTSNENNFEIVMREKDKNLISLIKTDLEDRIKSFSRIGKRWLQVAGGTPRNLWESDATQYIKDQKGYVAIEWVDSDYIVRWSVPLETSQEIIGYNLYKDKSRRLLIERSKSKQSLVLSPQIDLIQGEKGILIVDPLIKNNHFMGFMVGVINSRIFFEYILSKINRENMGIKIFVDNNLIYSNNNTEFEDLTKWRRTQKFKLDNYIWSIEVSPNIVLYNTVISTKIEYLSLLLGLIISFLSGILTHFLISVRSLQLKASIANDRLKGIIESPSELIAAIDTNRNFIIFNQSYHDEIYRLLRIELQSGMSWEKISVLMSKSDRVIMDELWTKALTGVAFTTIHAFKRLDSHPIYFEIHFNPIYDSEKVLIGASHIATNIDLRIQNQHIMENDRNQLKTLVSDLENKNNELYLLKELISMLNINESVEQFIFTFSHYIERLFSDTAGILYLQSEITQEFEAAAQWNKPIYHVNLFTIDECYGLLQNRPYIVKKSQFKLPCKHLLKNLDKNFYKNLNYICIPLLVRDKKLGLMYVEFTSISESFDKQKSQFLQLVCEQISLALYNIQLKNHLKSQSIHDPLTGLHNRRYLEEYLSHEIIASKRYSKKFWIILVDIDHFKKVNDNFGHLAGDQVIKTIAKTFKNEFRESDLISRWGGEEFLVLVKEIATDFIQIKCENLRKKIENTTVDYLGQEIKITVSIGIAEFEKPQTKEEMIQRADDALYEAKNTGKNKCVYINLHT